MPPWSFWWGQRDKSTDSNIKPQPKLNSHNVCCSCGLGQFNQYFWGWIIFYKGYNPVNNKALPLRNALSTCFSDNVSWRLIYALIKCLDAPKWAGLMPTVIKHWFLHCQNIIEGTVFYVSLSGNLVFTGAESEKVTWRSSQWREVVLVWNLKEPQKEK